ncbi:uncharacterized protein B0H64DRAFT_478797 [Chaetomium fimeti]|uniref:Uncharacterized protein n=1 Tax=Chaetomium fimeti TaxID=1854472 RepID=A0AAE0LMU7_9PEZI|nr:hypothetical protein B0H64DRAFT_478797 [Chaetomium fimeti]
MSSSWFCSALEGASSPSDSSEEDVAFLRPASVSLATPTPVARANHNRSSQSPSFLAAAAPTPSSPAATILAVPASPPTRRLLFPEAPYSGARSRPFASPGQTPDDDDHGTTAVTTTWRTFTPPSLARFPARPLPVYGPAGPAYNPAGRRVAIAGGPSSTLPSWLVGSASVRMEMGAVCGVGGDGRSISRLRGEQGNGAVAGGRVGTSTGLHNFVQQTNAVPGSSSVLLGPRGSAAVPTAAPSTGWVESMGIDAGNLYARFLRVNSEVLAGGSGVVAVQQQQDQKLELGGGSGVGVCFLSGVDETEVLPRDEVCEESESDTAYPQRFLTGSDAIPHVSVAATFCSATSTNQRALPPPMFEMRLPDFTFVSGNRLLFNPDQTDLATVSSGQNNASTFPFPRADFSDSFIDPDLFATTSQQPAFHQPTDRDTEMGRMEAIGSSAIRESIENGQHFQYQLTQTEASTSTDTQSPHANAHQAFYGTEQMNLSYQTRFASDFHFGIGNGPQADNMSTIAHMGSDMGAAELARALSEATSAGYYGSYVDTNEEHDRNSNEDGDHDSDEDSDHDGDEDDGEPMPHIPAVHPDLIYDRNHNPAAAYWSAVPGDPTMNGYTLPAQPQAISIYDPSLPTFDTDPFLPFAPWRVNQLPPFIPEPSNRVTTITARNLAAVGQLYPDATFLIARYPASANFTARIKGAALATSAALHLPAFTDPAQSQNAAHDDNNTDGAGDDGPTYIAALAQRDWPIGGVAFFPATSAAKTFVATLQGAFDVLPRGQEVFYFLPHDVRYADGSVGAGKGVWVCRAYEGRRGPQDRRLIEQWMAARGGRVEQDGLGREVLVRMGEAWIEPEKWPRAGRGGGAGSGGRKRGGGCGGV